MSTLIITSAYFFPRDVYSLKNPSNACLSNLDNGPFMSVHELINFNTISVKMSIHLEIKACLTCHCLSYEV